MLILVRRRNSDPLQYSMKAAHPSLGTQIALQGSLSHAAYKAGYPASPFALASSQRTALTRPKDYQAYRFPRLDRSSLAR